MAYKVIILYRLYMPSYFLGTFTEYPYEELISIISCMLMTLQMNEFKSYILSVCKIAYNFLNME